MTFRPGIGTITIIALLVRIAFVLLSLGMATDEANGVMIAVSGSWADMLENLKQDGNAPVFYALVRYVDSKFGHSEFTVKALAAIIATIQVPAIYGLFRLVLPRYICLQLAWIIAFCPSMLRYGILIRPYALVALISLVSSMLCIKVLTRGSGRLWSIPYGISTALIVYTHYWGAFVAIGQAGLAVVGLVKRWFGRQEIVNWLIGVGISLLLFAPQIPTLLYQLKHDLSPWDNMARPLGLIAFFLPGTMLDIGGRASWVDQVSMVICNVLVIVALTSTIRFYRQDDEVNEAGLLSARADRKSALDAETDEETATETSANPESISETGSEHPDEKETEEAGLGNLLAPIDATADSDDTGLATAGNASQTNPKTADTASDIGSDTETSTIQSDDTNTDTDLDGNDYFEPSF
jgi:Predicted membrane protein